ncbi:MAG TPA: OmpH family outer membrane protein [Terriglobia bacterium]|nr:OmpH family outer membrane protein [Terriglobia bacterium]
MRIIRIGAIALAISLGATVALAQTAPEAKTASVPKGKIAMINSVAFQEQVDEFREAIAGVRRKMEPRAKELQSQAEKIDALNNTLRTQRQILSATRLAEMTETLNQLSREYQRKAEDFQRTMQQEQNAAFDPIASKIGRFAAEYSAKRGIVLLVDLGSGLQSGALIWHDPRVDVTRDFIAEYNKANPVPPAAQKQ